MDERGMDEVKQEEARKVGSSLSEICFTFCQTRFTWPNQPMLCFSSKKLHLIRFGTTYLCNVSARKHQS